MQAEEVTQSSREGVTTQVTDALEAFERDVRAVYGERVAKLILFGSRARGGAHGNSDVDVAVVLNSINDRWMERERLWDIGYRMIVDFGVEVQGWPLTDSEWRNPELHTNPRLVKAMKKEGLLIENVLDSRLASQSASLR